MGKAAATVPGAMTAVRGTVDDVAPVLKAVGEGLVLANHNAPKQVVLAGSVADIERGRDAVDRARSRFQTVGRADGFPFADDDARHGRV